MREVGREIMVWSVKDVAGEGNAMVGKSPQVILIGSPSLKWVEGHL